MNLAVCFVCLLLFGLLRCRGGLASFYAPKAYVLRLLAAYCGEKHGSHTAALHRFLSDADQKVKPRRLQSSFFGWIGPTLQTREEELIGVAGIDAAVYMRLLSFGRSPLL